jgi:hypothetical protein
MHFPLDFRLGIAIFLALIFSGAGSYAYSNQVSYSYQVPITQYMPQQRSQYVTVYGVNVSHLVNGGDSIYFGPWNAVATPFDTIAFNFAEISWATWLSIEGVRNGVVWSNVSEHHNLRYISVWPNDTYKIRIWNLNPNQSVFMYGTIAVFHTQIITDYVPYTTYQTQWSSYTEYPYRSIGSMLLFLGILAGIVTGVSVLLSRRRMKEVSSIF